MRSKRVDSRDRSAGGVTRRTFVKGLAVAGAGVSFGAWSGQTLTAQGNPPARWREIAGSDFDLRIGETPMNFTGNPRVSR
jgi:hypothetical protein